MFNCIFLILSTIVDTITLYYHGESGNEDRKKVEVTRTNIAWESDKTYKFSNGECKEERNCTVDELKESTILNNITHLFPCKLWLSNSISTI